MAKVNRDWRFLEFERAFKREIAILPSILGEVARRHFTVSFTKLDGFNDSPFQRWPNRKGNKDPGRKLLVLTSRLKNGIKKKLVAGGGVKIVNSVKYAATHNDGLRVRKRGGGFFKMPQRQFIGESNILNKRTEKEILRRGKALLRQIARNNTRA